MMNLIQLNKNIKYYVCSKKTTNLKLRKGYKGTWIMFTDVWGSIFDIQSVIQEVLVLSTFRLNSF